MKQYIIAGRSLIAVESGDTIKAEVIDYNSTAIDYLWIAPSDGTIDGTEVKEGDIIMRLYGRGDHLQPKTVVLRDIAFAEHIKAYNDYKPSYNCDCDCENCCRPA